MKSALTEEINDLISGRWESIKEGPWVHMDLH